MLFINLKFALRNIIRQKGFSFISILGLSIGMACTILISLWVIDEISYDNFHRNAKKLYRLTMESKHPNTEAVHFARCWQNWTPQDFKDQFPEIKEVIRLCPQRNTTIRIGDDKFFNNKFYSTDATIFDLFDLELISGKSKEALTNPNSVVISENIARKYFKNTNPLGQIITTVSQFDTAKIIYKVTGVIKNIPSNSHFHIDLLASIAEPKKPTGWAYTYVLLKEGTSTTKILEKIPGFAEKFMKNSVMKENRFFLQNIKDIHLNSSKDREIEENGSMLVLNIFIVVTFLILLVALVNYANINIATAIYRTKFVFVNNVVGARFIDIASYFISEAFLLNLLAINISVILVELSRPWFNEITGKQLLFTFSLSKLNLFTISFLVFLISVIVGSISSMSVFIKASSVIPQLLKSKASAYGQLIAKKHSRAGNVFTVLQFTISIVLIIGIVIIMMQVKFMLSKRLGKEDDKIIVLSDLSYPIMNNYSTFKTVLLSDPAIKEVSASMESPSYEVLDRMKFETTGIKSELKDSLIYVFPVDDNYIKFFNLQIIEGSDFPEFQNNESPENYIINETALKILGWKTPQEAIGKPFKLKFNQPGIFKGGKIVGVVKDFYQSSLRKPSTPMVLFQKSFWFWNFLVKIDGKNIQNGLKAIEAQWKKLYPDYPFSYSFTDDLYNQIYKSEIRQFDILVVFTILAIFISCIGLFGISLIQIQKKTKEIGIRKVNGARITEIILLLIRRYAFLILIAFVIASPSAFLIANKWLQNFAYRVEISWWIFLVAGVAAVAIALLTVSWQAFKAATSNPVDSLRYE